MRAAGSLPTNTLYIFISSQGCAVMAVAGGHLHLIVLSPPPRKTVSVEKSVTLHFNLYHL